MSTAKTMEGGVDTHRQPRVGRTSRQAELQFRVLQVAERLFSDRGFESVTMVDIAADACTSKGTVLYHFHSKNDLWCSTIDKIVQDYEAALARYGVSEEAELPDIENLIRIFPAVCIEVPSYPRITALESGRDTWRAQWFGERHLRRHLQFFHGNFERWRQQGHLPDVDPLVLQAVTLGSYELFYNQAPMIKAAIGRDILSDAFTDLYVQQVLAFVRSR